jgi:hypothetical protein
MTLPALEKSCSEGTELALIINTLDAIMPSIGKLFIYIIQAD